MSESNVGRLDEARLPALTLDSGDDIPLEDFFWSDEIVGMGYFPDEVGLPHAWARYSRVKP